MNPYFKCFIYTFVISAVILVLFFMFVLLRTKNKFGLSYNINIDQLRNGDLVAFDCSNFINSVIKWSINSDIVHLGMIWIDKGIPYVIEAVNYHNDPWHGIIKIPLNTWMKINSKRTCVWYPYLGYDITSKTIEHSWERWKHVVKFDLDFLGILDVFFPRKWYDKYKYDDHYVFCFEFVSIILQDIGILDRKWTPHSYTINKILESSKYSDGIIIHNLL